MGRNCQGTKGTPSRPGENQALGRLCPPSMTKLCSVRASDAKRTSAARRSVT
ncbi:unnamed protein product [Tetraodon nigroviridis]|uniref:(spotted green pufferfish) hypothetical protein n=1 Tax=Tetraodon nigroviridis TaxID=99883 RepID=Q4SR06_TETNG|nr:unnamed protein product [Tetraodon nigroviridis]